MSVLGVSGRLTLLLHAGENLHIGDIVELVGGRRSHRVLVHLGGAQLAVH